MSDLTCLVRMKRGFALQCVWQLGARSGEVKTWHAYPDTSSFDLGWSFVNQIPCAVPLQKRRSSKSTVQLAGSGLLAHSSCTVHCD